jgi:hypothetical protein
MEWISENKQYSFQSMKNEEIPGQACLLVNTVSISQIMKKVSEDFTKLFQKNAYLHWYT